MPNYRYKARDMEGETHTGVLGAPDREALAHMLREREQFLLEAEQAEAERTGGRRGLGRTSVSRQDLVLFTLQLATSLDAGIQIIQALDELREDLPADLAAVSGELRDDIQAGASLSEAMSNHPKVFGDLYTNLVAAGEETGTVPTVLSEIASYLEWQDELISDLRQMAIYPAVILGGVAILMVILFNFVLPRLLGTITGLGVELSTPTRLLILLSEVLSTYWWAIFLLVGAGVAGFLALRRTERGRYAIDKALLRVPILGEVVRKVALTRFTHNLSTLYGAGIGILRALDLVEAVVGNAVIEERIRTARDRVNMGSTLSESLEDAEEFPGLVLQMIAVGERTGSLDTSLEKVSEFYDREIPRTMDRFFSFLEPAIIVILGVLIAMVALGVYLPIYTVIQQIGR